MALDEAGRVRELRVVTEGLLGQRIPDYSGENPDTRQMLTFLFPGKSDRQPVATNDAARRLGVSPDTVRRWMRGVQQPRAATATDISRRVRQSVTTKRGRAQLLKRMPPPQGRRTLSVTGLQGPSPDPTDRNYVNVRAANHKMSPERQQELYDAWVSGGAAGAIRDLADQYGGDERAGERNYVPGWVFHDIYDLKWGRGN